MEAPERTTADEMPGLAASRGMALGRAFRLDRALSVVPERRIGEDEIEAELERFRNALQASAEQVRALAEASDLERDLRMIFDAQLLLFEDPMLIDETEERIRSRRRNAEWALASEVENLKGFLLKNPNEVFRERAIDLEDAGNRILANLMGVGDGDVRAEVLRNLPPDRILIAHEMPPSLMLHVRRNCAGIVTEGGGVAGHMAILAKSRGIPALVRVPELLARLQDGDELLVDAEAGRLIRNPAPAQLEAYQLYVQGREEQNERRRTRQSAHSPAQTADGTRVRFDLNLDDHELIDGALHGASGVGLFRSEFLYMRRPHLFHQREEHAEQYAALFRATPGRTVTIRLLDAGGDKPFPADGPVQGQDRGLRGAALLLENERLLEEQLRAILIGAERAGRSAAASGSVRIMLPMVSRLEELLAARIVFDRVCQDLSAAQSAPLEQPSFGVMIETPAAACMAETFAAAADFFSVGSNDLTRLALGVDRNAALPGEELFFQPAVFRLLAEIRARIPEDRPLAICGEIAARREALPALLGLGYRTFSVSASSLYDCFEAVESLRLDFCHREAQRVLQAKTAAEVRSGAVEKC